MSTTTNDGTFPEASSSLYEIVHAVAETDSTCYEDNTSEMRCPFCAAFQTQHQWLVEDLDFPHEPDCIVTKARALVEQAKEREQ